MDAEAVRAFANLLGASERAVFFGGAGVSTESGIPDFRSADGLYAAEHDYGFPPEMLLSIDMLQQSPQLFFRYYTENLIHLNSQPNAAHQALAAWEQRGNLSAVITQNIDGLHQQAGSQRVLELHGSNWRPYCMRCRRRYQLSYLMDHANWRGGVPVCSHPAAGTTGFGTTGFGATDVGAACGGTVRPDVVLYGEPLPEEVVAAAANAIADADLLIVAGTSLTVFPAAALVQLFNGPNLVLINKTPTALDSAATLLFHQPVGAVFAATMSVE